MQLLNRLLVGTSILLVLAGCAPLGTYSRRQPGLSGSSFPTLGYVIPDVAQARHSPFYRSVDSLFVLQLDEQLRAVAGPRPVRYLGQLRTPAITPVVIDSLARKHPEVAGLLLCALIIRASDSTLQAISPNTKVKLLLIQGATQQVVAQTRFNTRLGKSYWLNPTVAAAISDATVGAVRPLRRIFSRVQL